MGTLMKENRKKEPMYITSMAYLQVEKEKGIWVN